jgi:hypothetical protein
LRDDDRHGYQRISLSLTQSLDTAPKPYYLVSKYPRRSRLATTALLGLAPVLSTRASAANHPESISTCRHADLGVAKQQCEIKASNQACPQHSCAREEQKLALSKLRNE